MLVFPLVKKSENFDKELDNVSQDDVDKLVNHYMGQIILHLNNHGFQLSHSFFTDLGFAHEFLRSSLMRSLGRYHPYQDFIDDCETQKMDETPKE